ncbi:hypothetical protein [Soonwooa sp.]|uniref:hypothetical protein n=1 Tax=Soonwooa sp. TaxID=1938592 RepID=UPI0028B0ECFB|nr:hypothetical protein [Soonwooa sp.]
MNVHPIFKELVTQDINIDNIFLDPNNPRFVSMNWDHISDELITDEKIQKKVIRKLSDEFSIDRLMMNMEINGFLPIDRVVLRPINGDPDNFVVLEGNRRICAAKTLIENAKENSGSIDPEILDSLSTIPALVYTGSNTEASWIFQGLRHIMGIQEWSAFNKAKLIVTLMEEEDLTLTEVGKRFGLTAFGAGQWVRGFYAFKQVKENSDFTKEADEKLYSFMQELFSRSNSAVREWLKWNETSKQFEDELNFNEFLSWLYPRDYENADESVNIETLLGDWKNRKLLRSDDIRTISYLISKSPREFEYFRSEKNLEKAYTIAIQKQYEEEAKKHLDPSSELYESLDFAIKNLENIPYKIIKDSGQRDILFAKLDKLEQLISELKS